MPPEESHSEEPLGKLLHDVEHEIHQRKKAWPSASVRAARHRWRRRAQRCAGHAASEADSEQGCHAPQRFALEARGTV